MLDSAKWQRAATQVDGYVFLSPEWVDEVTRVVQFARKNNQYFRNLAAGFSLSLAYLVHGIPRELGDRYRGGSQAAIFVQLDKGTVRRIQVGRDLPEEKVDILVASNYRVARKILQGKSSPSISFANRQLKVQRVARVFQRPAFTARSIVAANMIVKMARKVPTVFESRI
jgi:hypothetical protein